MVNKASTSVGSRTLSPLISEIFKKKEKNVLEAKNAKKENQLKIYKFLAQNL